MAPERHGLSVTESAERVRREVEQFLYLEARFLDERRFEEWLGLYCDDARMWAPLHDGDGDPATEASLVYDDRELLEARVRRLRHPQIHSQIPAARGCRLVGNVMIARSSDDGNEITAQSSFVMLESRMGEQRVFGGHYEHELRRVDGAWRIARKIVRLANRDAVLSNLGLPF
jgi:benzoate/toluate 1,2-dioxygenase beta subunit